jgi:hypothetical protein
MQSTERSLQVETETGTNTISTQLLKDRDTLLQNIIQLLDSVNEETEFQENIFQYSIIHQNVIKVKQQDPNWKLSCYYEENCIRLKHYSSLC